MELLVLRIALPSTYGKGFSISLLIRPQFHLILFIMFSTIYLEVLMGCPRDYTQAGADDTTRAQMLGNSFHTGVLARLLEDLPRHRHIAEHRNSKRGGALSNGEMTEACADWHCPSHWNGQERAPTDHMGNCLIYTGADTGSHSTADHLTSTASVPPRGRTRHDEAGPHSSAKEGCTGTQSGSCFWWNTSATTPGCYSRWQIPS